MNHLSATELERIRSGAASGREVLAFSQHIAECEECAAHAEEKIATLDSASAVHAAFSMPAAPPAPHPRFRSFWLAAAAVLACAFVAVLLMRGPAEETPEPPRRNVGVSAPAPAIRRPEPAKTDVSPVRPEWRALAAEVRRTGKLPLPADIREFASEDTFRGTSTSSAAASNVSPSATAVEDARPEFRWPTSPGARYVVTVAQGTQTVAESPTLRDDRWRPPAPLPRGRVYSWQVRVTRGEEIVVLPAPPAPPALFRVITDAQREELESARRECPDDHFLLGVLYARAGIIAAARAELEQSKDPAARALLSQL
jgi:hypothetical protein